MDKKWLIQSFVICFLAVAPIITIVVFPYFYTDADQSLEGFCYTATETQEEYLSCIDEFTFSDHVG